MTDTPDIDLGEYHGRPITQVAIGLKGTGDGLSKALGVDPVKHTDPGEIGHVLVRYVVDHFEYRQVDKKNADPELVEWIEIPIVTATGMTPVSGAEYVALVDGQQERNAARSKAVDEARKAAEAQAARDAERAAGVKHLPGTPEDLEDDHLEGKHTAPVEGCPSCDWEDVSDANERAADAAKGGDPVE